MSVTLTPGATPDWTETTQPAQRGTSTVLGYDLQPGVRWTTVPFQRYESSMVISLDAFHLCGKFTGDEGIEKVEFIANDGAVATVTAPSPHPITGIWSWWVELLPLATDGIVEIRAIVYPWHGIPVVAQGGFITTLGTNIYLPTSEQSMLLWSNANGNYDEANVWVDIAAPGGGDGTQANPWNDLQSSTYEARTLGPFGDGSFVTVNMAAGEYPFHCYNFGVDIAMKGWMTFQPAAGVDPDDVVIAGNGASGVGSVRTRLTRLKNLNIRKLASDDFAFLPAGAGTIATLWYEGVHHTGYHKWLDGDPNQGCYLDYFTSSTLRRGRSTLAANACRARVSYQVDYTQSSGEGVNNAYSARCNTYELIAYPGGLGLHPGSDEFDHLDDWQSLGHPANSLCGDNKFIGVETSKGLFWDRAVNRCYEWNTIHGCIIGAGDGAVSGGPCGGLFHCSFPHHNLWVVTDPTNISGDGGAMEASTTRFGVTGCVISGLIYIERGGAPVLSQAAYEAIIDASGDVQFSGNHYITGSWFEGEDPTNGAVEFDADFRPLDLAADIPRTVRWDLEQNLRQSTTTRGAYAGLGEAPVAPVHSIRTGTVCYPTRELSLSAADESAEIWFTDDGTTPTNGGGTSVLYDDPITIGTSKTIKSRSYVAGTASTVTTGVYPVDDLPCPSFRPSTV